MAARFLIAALRVVPAKATVSVHREALPEHPEHADPCIPRATRQLERPRVRVPASASAPEWAHARASDSAPVAQAEQGDSFRLQAKRRVHSAAAPARDVAVRFIRRPKKAR